MTTASATTLTPAELAGDYAIDPTHSRLGFVARHAMVSKVRGGFDEFEGTAHLDFEDPSRSTATISFAMASINTNQKQRDEHLRTSDFFDVTNHPTGRFQSTSVNVIDDETFEMNGDLTLRGITKAVTITWASTGVGRDPYSNLRVGFEGKAVLSRKEFGIEYNAALETGGVLISDKISLELDISAIKG